jgi:hypothetical protein
MESIQDPIEQNNTREMTLEDARIRIMEIRQRIALMGANDSEFFSIDQIIGQMDRAEIEPAAALEEVTRILTGKQDYH